MLDVNKKAHTDHQSSIARWAYQAIGLKGVRLRTRLQGNDLHILCESTQCPSPATVVPRFVKALNEPGATSTFLTDPEQPIYQVILYGRALESQRPDWMEAIHLNQDASQWQRQSRGDEERIDPDSAVPLEHEDPEHESALIRTAEELPVSNQSLTGLGQPDSIAHYLSETLSPLGVGVKVIVQDSTASGRDEFNASSTQNSLKRRLWVICNADYSPDPSLVAQAVTQRLRSSGLEGFHDARILALVSGETTPDWVLRVDMTPPEEMLKDWARWGDVQAIARLLHQALANEKIQVRGVLKQSTLHLFCRTIPDNAKAFPKGVKTRDLATGQKMAPDQQTVMSAIAPILESIGPQGIQAAMVYGMVATSQREAPSLVSGRDVTCNVSTQTQTSLQEETSVWSEWLNLPACCCPALAETPLKLAQKGDEPALVFLVQRLLNSDLDWRLATGGIRVSLRRKQDLLHIMTEAPVCPLQSQVASPIANFMRKLQIPKIAGVRVYGRRAGQSSPLWSYGVDFTPRSSKSSPVEFAASADFSSDQILSFASADRPVETQDLASLQTTGSALSRTLQAWGRELGAGLCATQLFIPAAQDSLGHWSFAIGHSSSVPDKGQTRIALVWGCLGLLLTFQFDWLIGQMLRREAESTQSSVVMTEGQRTSSPLAVKPIPQMSLQKQGSVETSCQDVCTKVGRNKPATFNSSGFTKQGETSVIVADPLDANNPLSNERASAGRAAILAAARSQLPSFNNRLLDEKLALYQQRLLIRGGVPPEVLIVGSSRAMRGIDPTALRNGLDQAGPRNIDVFNFAINGATAQVVDLMVRRILTPSQLPKLIIWADGARAFNSGRVDATYNAIASSVGYQQLNAGTFPTQNQPAVHRRGTDVLPGRLYTAPKEPSAPSESNVETLHVTSLHSLLRPSLTSGYQVVESQLNQALAKISSTYPQRDQLTSLILLHFAQLIPGSAEYGSLIGGSDVTGEGEDANLVHLNSDIDFDGFLPLPIRFVPATYYKQHAKVSGDYDGDYESFQMSGQQDAALNSLLQFVQDNQIQLVFVNLPLTKEYLDPIRTKYEQEFQRHLRQAAREKGLIFRDLRSLWPTKNEFFSDPSHLNQYGANEVSNQLLQDPIVPWPSH